VGGARAGYTSAGAGGGVGAEWWRLAKLVFVLRGVRPEASAMPAYDGLPADDVLGVGVVNLRDVVSAPNCRLECELGKRTHRFKPFDTKNDHFAKTGSGQTWGTLNERELRVLTEMRVRHAVGDPVLGKLRVAAELREDSVALLARR
jgi:hypothetical protein